MPSTSDASRSNTSFNWETNDMSQTDEDTPYLERKESFVGPIVDPLDEFLAIPSHSPAKRLLPRLFHPLCNNPSVLNHLSDRLPQLHHNAVWLDDSSPKQGRRDYSGPMTNVNFLKNLKLKVLTQLLLILENGDLTSSQRLGQNGYPDARIRCMYERYKSLSMDPFLIFTATSLTLATILSVVLYAERPGTKERC